MYMYVYFQSFILNLLTTYFLRSLCTTFISWKVQGHAVAGKEASCLEDSQIVPHFAFMSNEIERGYITLFLPSVDWWAQIDGLDFKLSTWCYIIPVMIFWNVWKLISRTEDQSIGLIDESKVFTSIVQFKNRQSVPDCEWRVHSCLNLHLKIIFKMKIRDSHNSPRWVLDLSFSVETPSSFQILDFYHVGTNQNFLQIKKQGLLPVYFYTCSLKVLLGLNHRSI